MRRHAHLIWAIAAALWAAAIFTVSGMTSDDLPDTAPQWSYVAHFCEYAVLGALLVLALARPTRSRWVTLALAVAVASGYGVTDEFHQWFVPGRQTDPVDWLTDTLGAALGATVMTLLRRPLSG